MEADSRPSSSRPSSSDSEPGSNDLVIVRHKVNKLDTLAGLAVKYGVTVSDIKRCNGLLSDSAMFARGTLLIPTKSLPVGPEYSTWAGMIVTHYGRITHDDVGPGSASYDHLHAASSSIEALRGYYSTGSRPSLPANVNGSAAGDEERWQLLANGPGSGPREVELMCRTESMPEGPSGLAVLDDRLRRRVKPGESPGSVHEVEANGSGGGAGPSGSVPRPASFSRPGGALMAAEPPGGRRPGIKWKDRLLHTVKRVASQPSLLGGPSQGAALAARPPSVGAARPQPLSPPDRFSRKAD